MGWEERGQARQLWNIQARCGRYTLQQQAMRRLLSWRPVLSQPRHGKGRKDIPPSGTVCTYNVITSLLGGKPQRGCSQTPTPPLLFRPGWPHEGWWELVREQGPCGMLPLPSDPQVCVTLSLLVCWKCKSYPVLDSAKSALSVEPRCH